MDSGGLKGPWDNYVYRTDDMIDNISRGEWFGVDDPGKTSQWKWHFS